MKRNHRKYRSSVVSLGRYTCCEGSTAAGPEQLSLHTVISVTCRGAWALHRDGRSEVADHTRAVLFNTGDVYRTSHPDRCDDSGYYLAFPDDVVVDVLRRHDARVAEHPERPFRELAVPMSPRAMLLGAAIFRDLRPAPAHADREAAARGTTGLADERADQLAERRLQLDERALLWLDLLFSTAPVPRAARPARREPSRAHRELADEARRLLARHSAERLSLTDLAACLRVSPFHLCRVFRSVTGSTLHGYLEDHRLAAALLAVSDPARELTAIAHACGFSSHSHFTARFRRRFGLTPSAFRRARS